MSCSGSDYGTHRCVRCDSEVDDVEAYARGVADERARVVADLRRMSRTWSGPDAAADRALAMRLADRYERGEHEGAIPGILIFGFPPVNP